MQAIQSLKALINSKRDTISISGYHAPELLDTLEQTKAQKTQ